MLTLVVLVESAATLFIYSFICTGHPVVSYFLNFCIDWWKELD